jgi:hypothetical protein
VLQAVFFAFAATASALSLGEIVRLASETATITRIGAGLAPVLGATAIVYGLSELFGLKLPVPMIGWVVPRNLPARVGSIAFASIFGAALGLGGVTVVNGLSYHVLVVGGLFGRVPHIVWILGTFGLVRGVPNIIIAVLASRAGLIDGQRVVNGSAMTLRRIAKSPTMLLLRASALLASGGCLLLAR